MFVLLALLVLTLYYLVVRNAPNVLSEVTLTDLVVSLAFVAQKDFTPINLVLQLAPNVKKEPTLTLPSEQSHANLALLCTTTILTAFLNVVTALPDLGTTHHLQPVALVVLNHQLVIVQEDNMIFV